MALLTSASFPVPVHWIHMAEDQKNGTYVFPVMKGAVKKIAILEEKTRASNAILHTT